MKNDIDKNSVTGIIELTDDTAWRFLTRSGPIEKIKNKINFLNDNEICRNFLNVKAILMKD